jgi:hypothetical protein
MKIPGTLRGDPRALTKVLITKFTVVTLVTLIIMVTTVPMVTILTCATRLTYVTAVAGAPWSLQLGECTMLLAADISYFLFL